MIVYVESNFILEIAHLREEHENCDRILNLSVTGEIQLVLPAFSVGEVYITRDSKDFANPDIVADLSKSDCELFTSFGEGYGFVIGHSV